MKLLTLYLLALLDGLLCGGRVSMGRCALIYKRAYYLRALVRGLLGAQIISTIALLALFAVATLSSHRTELRADLEAAAARMLWIFVPYAIAVLGSLAFRLIPSTDLRSATSVFALGPFTAIRPLIMIAGVLFGIAPSHLQETRHLGLFVLALMLSMEYFLNRSAAIHQSKEIRQLI
jgi:hypothetical protein